LHSILFAILTATPAIALAYDPKVRSLARRVGHEEICLGLTELSMLNELIAAMWERRDVLSNDFARARIEMGLLSEKNADLACELLNAEAPESASRDEHSDVFANAFYGRLQAVRVRDRMITKQNEARELREIIGIIEGESQPRLSLPFKIPDSKTAESLSEFLDRAVTEYTEHLVLIYRVGYSRDATDLVEALVDRGIPTVLIGGAEQSTTHAVRLTAQNFSIYRQQR